MLHFVVFPSIPKTILFVYLRIILQLVTVKKLLYQKAIEIHQHQIIHHHSGDQLMVIFF
jgi:hypothetical protein